MKIRLASVRTNSSKNGAYGWSCTVNIRWNGVASWICFEEWNSLLLSHLPTTRRKRRQPYKGQTSNWSIGIAECNPSNTQFRMAIWSYISVLSLSLSFSSTSHSEQFMLIQLQLKNNFTSYMKWPVVMPHIHSGYFSKWMERIPFI